MLLSTLQCSKDLCDREYTFDGPMAEVIYRAEDQGWVVMANGASFCPDHGPEATDEKWLVGCYTCDFEEEFESEDDARWEYNQHECEPDTWIWDPSRVLQEQTRRSAYDIRRHQDAVQARQALQEAQCRQEQLEQDAANWLRLRNVVFFWRRR